jgi:hypothetical protein
MVRRSAEEDVIPSLPVIPMVMNPSENRRLRMEILQETMRCHLVQALKGIKDLDPATELEVAPLVEDLFLIKMDIEARALALGYPLRCKEHSPICRGQCCKWHFPENLDAVDFFLALRAMDSFRRSELLSLLQQKVKGLHQCPLLKDDGCFFNFKQRPMVCATAYPCFLNTAYWRFQNERAPAIHGLKKKLAERLCLKQRE